MADLPQIENQLRALAFFALILFTKSAPGVEPTPQKRARNRIYRLCGWAIVASIAVIAITKAAQGFLDVTLLPAQSVFWLESVAVIAFGVSWLVKGEALGILVDQE